MPTPPKKPPQQRREAIKVQRGKFMKASSQKWLQRHLNDPYVQMAWTKKYRARSAFKILEIHEKYKLFKPGQVVIDLGAAPGGWAQVVLPLITKGAKQGSYLGVDLLPIDPIPPAVFFQGDFLDADFYNFFVTQASAGSVDVVLSDMAANTTGHQTTDHIRTQLLAESAFRFAELMLKPGGVFVAKVFAGGTHPALQKILKQKFKTVSHFKPPASRKESPEMYVVCQGFRP